MQIKSGAIALVSNHPCIRNTVWKIPLGMQISQFPRQPHSRPSRGWRS